MLVTGGRGGGAKAGCLMFVHVNTHRARHLIQLAHGLVDSSFQVIIEFPRPVGQQLHVIEGDAISCTGVIRALIPTWTNTDNQ